MKNRITELLNVKYPIIMGGMQWLGRAELASAVSNAGGFGIISALTQASPEDLSKEINRCREMTDKPFGVNLTILPTIKPVPYQEYAQAAIEGGIKVVETAGRNPQAFMPAFNAAGVKVIHKCTSVRHALKAEAIGCAAVSVDGFECAGHPGEDDVTNLVLLPAAARRLSIPMIASGGIGNGQQMAAAMMLGAEGINMGTRFVATKECTAHENMKQAIVEADERQTALMFRTLGNTARVFRNQVSEQVIAIEAQDGKTEFSDLQPLVAGARGKARAIEQGEINEATWTIGMVIGLIDDIPSCEDLIERIMQEARDSITQQHNSLLG